MLAGGAGGYVLANNEVNGDMLNSDSHKLPALHIGYNDGVDLKAWLATGSNHQAAISGTTVDENAAHGDLMSAFSSRGANAPLPSVIKPDVSAPGLDVLAAHGTENEAKWDVISGTSMASPHAAGAAALLMAVHPSWSPAEIQSALMTTAVTTVRLAPSPPQQPALLIPVRVGSPWIRRPRPDSYLTKRTTILSMPIQPQAETRKHSTSPVWPGKTFFLPRPSIEHSPALWNASIGWKPGDRSNWGCPNRKSLLFHNSSRGDPAGCHHSGCQWCGG